MITAITFTSLSHTPYLHARSSVHIEDLYVNTVHEYGVYLVFTITTENKVNSAVHEQDEFGYEILKI